MKKGAWPFYMGVAVFFLILIVYLGGHSMRIPVYFLPIEGLKTYWRDPLRISWLEFSMEQLPSDVSVLFQWFWRRRRWFSSKTGTWTDPSNRIPKPSPQIFTQLVFSLHRRIIIRLFSFSFFQVLYKLWLDSPKKVTIASQKKNHELSLCGAPCRINVGGRTIKWPDLKALSNRSIYRS